VRVKFWELVSACRSEPDLLNRIADRRKWAIFAEWYRQFDQLVREQDRAKLDAELPDDLCEHVLEASNSRYYVSEGYIRIRRYAETDTSLTSLDIYRLYGGGLLEEIDEFGAARIPT
jgi:hypothetical protein